MAEVAPTAPQRAAIRAALLARYDRDARPLPWRVDPAARRAGVIPDPYRVWLSEVMLQQTTTTHAAPYFQAFTARWPTVEALAAASEGEVMAAWAGLGYYARARNLIACARAVARDHRGVFPDTEVELLKLPGLGAYTAAAVAAIAFDRAANVVDGNVERVVARMFAFEPQLPAARLALRRLAAGLVTEERPGDWAQALMDHGAVVCRPRAPRCDACPAADLCAARARGDPQSFPRKARKAEGARRFGTAFVLMRDGEVALVRRDARGLLGAMLGLPTSAWTDVVEPVPPPIPAAWREVGSVEHVFTHFPLTLAVMLAESPTAPAPPTEWIWTPAREALEVLPSVFAKALRQGLSISAAPRRVARTRSET